MYSLYSLHIIYFTYYIFYILFFYIFFYIFLTFIYWPASIKKHDENDVDCDGIFKEEEAEEEEEEEGRRRRMRTTSTTILTLMSMSTSFYGDKERISFIFLVVTDIPTADGRTDRQSGL